MSGDRSEDDDMDRPPEDEPRDEPQGGRRDPPPEDEPRGGGRQPRDDRPPADEPRGGRRDEPRGGGRQPRQTGPGAMDIIQRQENMTLVKTYGVMYALIGVTVGIGSLIVGTLGGGSGFSQLTSIPVGAGPGMVGAVLAFGPLLAAVAAKDIRSSLDQSTRELYITAAATGGIGSLAMGLIGGILGLASGVGAAGVLVGAILMALLSAGVGAGTIWGSDWAERSSQPMRRPAGGRQGEPRDDRRGDRRDDRQPR